MSDCRSSNYLDVYFSRAFHRGESVAEVAQNTGERSFASWLAGSVHTVKDLSVERGLYFSGIILTNKDKEHQKIMFLNVANDIPILVGDIVNWKCDGQVEKWIIFSKEKKVNGTYQTFSIIRCNYLMKWVDKNGHLQSSWSHFVSSMDSKVKENFRTWNSLITPQQNKFAELLLPRQEIERGTSFIVEDEAWYVVEYDHTSVPGVMYLSLVEEKVNYVYDDLEHDIADTDKLAVYEIVLPENMQNFNIGDEVKPIYTLTKNGFPSDEEVTYTPADKKYLKFVDGKLIAQKVGKTTIIIQLASNEEIKQELEINIGEAPVFNAYLNGGETIRLDRRATYEFIANEPLTENVAFSISDDAFAFIEETSPNKCVVRANADNKLGKVTLRAVYRGAEYFKTIEIIPLW